MAPAFPVFRSDVKLGTISLKDQYGYGRKRDAEGGEADEKTYTSRR